VASSAFPVLLLVFRVPDLTATLQQNIGSVSHMLMEIVTLFRDPQCFLDAGRWGCQQMALVLVHVDHAFSAAAVLALCRTHCVSLPNSQSTAERDYCLSRT